MIIKENKQYIQYNGKQKGFRTTTPPVKNSLVYSVTKTNRKNGEAFDILQDWLNNLDQ